jgi:hypothetical protein
VKLPPKHRGLQRLAEALPRLSAAELADAVERISSPDVSKMYVPERHVLAEAARRLRVMTSQSDQELSFHIFFRKMRMASRKRILFDTTEPGEVLREFVTASEVFVQDFCAEHDVSGVRYWLHIATEIAFVTAPGETLGKEFANDVKEVTRAMFVMYKKFNF